MKEEEIRNEAISSMIKIMPWFRNVASSAFSNKAFDLTRIQLLMVMALYYHGAVSMGTLAKLVGTSNEQVTRAANRLQEKEYVIKEQDKYNRRIVNIYLSEKAKKQVKDIEDRYLQQIKEKFDIIPIEDMKKLAESADFICGILDRIDEQ